MSRVIARLRNWIGPITINHTNLATGLATTAAMLVPLSVGYAVGETDLGLAISLGSLLVALIDPGGSYRMRFRWMLAGLLLGAIVAVICGLAGNSVWTAAPTALVLVAGSALLSAYGNAATRLGTAMAFTVAVMTSLPIDAAEVPERFWTFLAGGAFAMFFILILWPFRPLAPAATAVSAYYTSISRLIEELANLLRDPDADPRAWEARTTDLRAAVINHFEEARTYAAAERTSHAGASLPTARLLELISVANRLYRWELSVSESVGILSQQPGFAPVRAPLADYFEQTARAVAAFSASISARKHVHADRTALHTALEEHSACCEALQRVAEASTPDAQPAAELAQLAEEAQHTHDLLERAAATLLGSIELEPEEELAPEQHRGAKAVWTTLAGNLSRGSSVTRYAARVGIAVALGIIVYSLFELEHGFWITFTIVAVMKPDFGGSRHYIVQRVSATVIGCILVAGLILAVQNSTVMLLLLWPIGLVGFTMISVNYRVGIIFFTMFIVVLVDLSTPGNIDIAGLRVLNTIIGGAIALATSYLLWPTWQRTLVPGQLADAISANRSYLLGVLAEQRDPAETRRLGRAARVADGNAAAAYQRLLSEPDHRRGNSVQFYVLVTHNQRIVTATTALDDQLELKATRRRDFGPFRSAADTTLRQLEQAVRDSGSAPASGALDDAFHELLYGSTPAVLGDLADAELGRVNDAIDAMVAATQVPEQSVTNPLPMPAPQTA